MDSNNKLLVYEVKRRLRNVAPALLILDSAFDFEWMLNIGSRI